MIFLFGQPGLDVNAGIGTGSSALVVAAMVGNDWAIARYILKQVDSELPRKIKTTFTSGSVLEKVWRA